VVLPEDQTPLFDPPDAAAAHGLHSVQPATPSADVVALGDRVRERIGDRLHLGTSSWHFPGWAGTVWAREYPEGRLSRAGLSAYARHPLLRCVSLDRAFYRPLEAATYARLASQVDATFRFVVKAPSTVTDAVRREPGSGKATAPNPLFLDPTSALELCVQPASQGLGDRLGVLVFQVSPLPRRWLDDPAALHARLAALCEAVLPALPSGALAALELRDPQLLTPELAALLRSLGLHYCLGLHDRMPSAEAQLPMLRALWPADFVCRWNLQRGQRYAQARDRWAPFDRLQAPDPQTRAVIARVARATLEAGRRVFVTINNKAEGSAPVSVLELARALV
jgi:uncharacterized protein YecE (DUF72 family)